MLAGEVGGRWLEETRDFLNQLARGKVRHEPAILRRRVQLAWHEVAALRGGWGADGDTRPSYEVSTFKKKVSASCGA